ncbi:myeloid-associated differentiation marker homolog [Takifugu flavidus]|uniref:myeloid-associated differentiation marker homolog n=1 Tax=Takifugu flavidus TaxID=433684 RepID=UPI00254493F6|nr:myeloid-associated differentiation marker homolog [Takifugu flavidus]XP_056884352.1 myeloid-associated differentiation marker homolog [Takifugu flavidus]XP_056884353.1 myeloid-associated differentiation marker homolog [Takifugu flavidus]XP_056884354.1 myeloid-associated differentiation marker homolog [Takifugu flavidus]
MPVSTVMLSRVFWVRLAALLFTCVAFSVAVHSANVHGGLADCCIFCWAFSFTCTLLVLLVEQFGLQARIPVSWSNISTTVAGYASLLCLFAFFIFVYFFIILQWYANERSFRITSTVFSCLAAVAYMYEVILIKGRARQGAGYMATAPGLLKVWQTSVAFLIFILISNPVSYSHHEALEWCMAVYCICFIVSMVVVILCVGECTGRKSVPFSQFLFAYSLLAFLMYLSAVIVWPIFTFGEKYLRGGDMTTQISVTVFTGLNMLLYLADLVYTAPGVHHQETWFPTTKSASRQRGDISTESR